MEIINSTLADLDFIFQLYDSAIDYQKKKGYDLWPQFSRPMVENDIAEKRLWKIIEDGNVLCIFTVMYNDPIIWGIEKDKDPSVYLHRTTINPEHKGKGMMKIIRQWSLEHAKQNNKKYVRMDTWGNNENLRNYYIQCGFNYIGQKQLYKTEGLPDHYGGLCLSLFENEV